MYVLFMVPRTFAHTAWGHRLYEDRLYLKHIWRNDKYALLPLRKKIREFDFICESVLSLWEWQRWTKRFFSTSSLLTFEPTVVADWDRFSCFVYLCICAHVFFVFVHLCINVFVFLVMTKIDISQRRVWLALFVHTKEREH